MKTVDSCRLNGTKNFPVKTFTFEFLSKLEHNKKSRRKNDRFVQLNLENVEKKSKIANSVSKSS